MAASWLDDSGFWLPTNFPADGDNKKILENVEFETGLCFPNDFPYEIDSPVDSVLSSNETESSDEDDFLAGLTRRFAQRLSVTSYASDKPERASAGSPQSTLSGIGSWSGNGSPNGTSQVSSPPATPFRASNDTWELIYAAAGQVARLKINGGAAKYSNQQASGLLGPPHSRSRNLSLPNQYVNQEEAMKHPCFSVWAAQEQHHYHQLHREVQIQNRGPYIGVKNRGCHRPLNLYHSTWPPLQTQHQNQRPQTHHSSPVMRPNSAAGSVSKRACAGTGVFLPRRGQINNPPDYRKKEVSFSGCSPVLVPAKVVHALNLNFNNTNGHAYPRAGGGVAPDHEALMARRNALMVMAQQRRRGAPEGHRSQEVVTLPPEWTY